MFSKTRKTFGERVRTLRKERGVSLRAFALMVGIDKGYLVDIEYGRKSPSLDTLMKLASGFGMTLSELFDGIAIEPDE